MTFIAFPTDAQFSGLRDEVRDRYPEVQVTRNVVYADGRGTVAAVEAPDGSPEWLEDELRQVAWEGYQGTGAGVCQISGIVGI